MRASSLLAMLVTVAVTTSVAAADSKPIAGSWTGSIAIPGQPIAITLTFDGNDAGLIDIPQQHAVGIPLAHVAVDGAHVTFAIPVVDATFDGTLDHDAIAGTLLQRGEKYPFQLARTAAIQRATYAPPPPPRRPLTAAIGHALLGRWEGTVHDPSMTRPIAIEFEARDGLVTGVAGELHGCAALDPISNLTLTGDHVHLAILGRPGLAPSYADFVLSGDTLTGTTFHGTQLAAELHRMPAEPAVPYREVELAIPSTGGATLAGTLTLPGTAALAGGAVKPPVVVLVTGSGPQDRDECVFGVRPFRQLADRLARDGIATLRYDDRGTAKSTGDFAASTTADFADDADAAVALLATRDDVDVHHIGVLGHSEGGMIAPLVAVHDPRVAFIVLWGGPGLPLERVMLQQAHEIALAEGATLQTADRNERIGEMVWKVFRAAKDEASFKRGIADGVAKLGKDDRAEIKDVPAFLDEQTKVLWRPWFRWYIGYDPAKTLAKVRVPVLAINGGMDKQVDAKANLAAIHRADPKAEIVELPGLNHLFQQTKTGAPSEYQKNSPALDPAVLDLTSAWIAKHAH